MRAIKIFLLYSVILFASAVFLIGVVIGLFTILAGAFSEGLKLMAIMLIPSGLLFALMNFTLKVGRCPKCKKPFAFKFKENNLISSSDISIRVENERKNARGDVIGTEEQYIDGTRKAIERVSQCRFCGEIRKMDLTHDVKNV